MQYQAADTAARIQRAAEDYVNRVHLMQRLNRPLRTPAAHVAILFLGMFLGMLLLASLRACDPLPVPVPAYAMRTQL